MGLKVRDAKTDSEKLSVQEENLKDRSRFHLNGTQETSYKRSVNPFGNPSAKWNTLEEWRLRQRGSYIKTCMDSLLTKQPQLMECPPEERGSVLVQKVRLCCTYFDFCSDPPYYEKLKEEKWKTLNELIEYVSIPGNRITRESYPDIFIMFWIHVSRPLPPSKREYLETWEADELEPSLDAAWPHLQLVYELFKSVLELPDFDIETARKFMDKRLIVALLDKFDSEDPRERKFLRIILQKIYGHFVSLRPFVRKQITYIFITFVYETERHNGIAELLEVVKFNISGYLVPLRKEHKNFISRVLMPLHMAKSMCLYYSELIQCVVEFLKKDSSLTGTVIKHLLKYWPITNTAKEIIFLNELTTVLNFTKPSDIVDKLKPLMKRLDLCCKSPHDSVRDKGLTARQYFLDKLTNNSPTKKCHGSSHQR